MFSAIGRSERLIQINPAKNRPWLDAASLCPISDTYDASFMWNKAAGGLLDRGEM
jgi:hypothetical protein